MRSSRYLAAVCVISLLGLVAGCSSSDGTISSPPAPLTPTVVAAGLNAVVPAAIQFPSGIIEILNSFIPPVPGAALGGISCSPLPLKICTTGEAEYCTTGVLNTTDWVFTNCVDDSGSTINGTARVNEVGSTATIVFPSSGFTVGGNALSGQLTINTVSPAQSIDPGSTVQFANLVITVEGNGATLNGGPLVIAGEVVNGVFQVLLSDSIFPAYQTGVTINSNSVAAIATDTSTTPPTLYTCTGTLSYSDGDATTDLTCVEGLPGA